MSWSVQAAIAKYHRLSSIKKTGIYFSQLWRPGSSRSRPQHGCGLVRALLLVHRQSSRGGRDRELCGVSLQEGTSIPFVGASSSWSTHLPEASPSGTTASDILTPTQECGVGHKCSDPRRPLMFSAIIDVFGLRSTILKFVLCLSHLPFSFVRLFLLFCFLLDCSSSFWNSFLFIYQFFLPILFWFFLLLL